MSTPVILLKVNNGDLFQVGQLKCDMNNTEVAQFEIEISEQVDKSIN